MRALRLAFAAGVAACTVLDPGAIAEAANGCIYKEWHLDPIGQGPCLPGRTQYHQYTISYCCEGGGVLNTFDYGTTCIPDGDDPMLYGIPPNGTINPSECGVPAAFCTGCGDAAYCDDAAAFYWDSDANPFFGPGRSLRKGFDCSSETWPSVIAATRRAIDLVAA